MITLWLALSLWSQAPEPVLETADCQPAGSVEGRVIRDFNLVCPTNVPAAIELQAYASAVAARTVSPVPLPRRAPGVSFNEEITFHLTEEGWRLLEPDWLLQTPASYPDNAVQRGLEARCDMRLQLASTGVPVQIDSQCQAFGHNERPRSGGNVFEENAIEASEKSVWLLPAELDTACITSKHDFILSHGRNDDFERSWDAGPVDGAPTCP